MNWEAVGAIGEILGALVVVSTLGYLARQVHFAHAAAADANRLNRANGVTQMALAVLANSELANSITKSHGLASYYEAYASEFGISTTEATRADWYHLYWFWLHWGQYSSSKTAADLAEISNIIEVFYQVPAVRYSWDHSPFGKPNLDPEFVAFADRVLSGASNTHAA